MKKLLVAGIIAVVLVFGFWIVAVPRSLLSGLISGSFKDSPVSIDLVNLQKGPFYDVGIRRLNLEKEGSTILSVDNVYASLIFSSLLRLRPAIAFQGDVAGGTVKGTLYFSSKGQILDVIIEKAHLQEVPILTQAGLGGKGTISGEYRARNNRGNMKFTLENAHIKPYSFRGVPLPLNMFREARGALETDGKILKIVSFVMEGKGIYARIRGNITEAMLDLTVEIMPDASLERQNMMFSMIRRYEVSPGHYSIPIRSALPF